MRLLRRLPELTLVALVCLFLAELTDRAIERRIVAWCPPRPHRARLAVSPKKTPKTYAWNRPEPTPAAAQEPAWQPVPGKELETPADEASPAPPEPPSRPRPVAASRAGVGHGARREEVPQSPGQPASPPDSTPVRAPAPGPGAATISRDELANIFLGQDDWIHSTTLKALPEGVSIHYTGQVPFSRLGVQSGDVLTSVNGHPLRSREDYRWAGNALREHDDFDVGVRRGGSDLTLHLHITP